MKSPQSWMLSQHLDQAEVVVCRQQMRIPRMQIAREPSKKTVTAQSALSSPGQCQER